MKEETQEAQVTPQPAQGPIELDLLKKRAQMMGIPHHPSIGLEKLKEKIQAKMADTPPTPEEAADAAQSKPISASEIQEETSLQRRTRLRKESAVLVRIRVTCMNPNKKDWFGEVYTVSNSLVGTFKKFVPFDNDEGYHVPNIIFQHMKERQCQVFTTVKGPRGNNMRKGKLIKELAIEVLPPLTVQDLKELATKQAMSHSLDD